MVCTWLDSIRPREQWLSKNRAGAGSDFAAIFGERVGSGPARRALAVLIPCRHYGATTRTMRDRGSRRPTREPARAQGSESRAAPVVGIEAHSCSMASYGIPGCNVDRGRQFVQDPRARHGGEASPSSDRKRERADPLPISADMSSDSPATVPGARIMSAGSGSTTSDRARK